MKPIKYAELYLETIFAYSNSAFESKGKMTVIHDLLAKSLQVDRDDIRVLYIDDLSFYDEDDLDIILHGAEIPKDKTAYWYVEKYANKLVNSLSKEQKV